MRLGARFAGGRAVRPAPARSRNRSNGCTAPFPGSGCAESPPVGRRTGGQGHGAGRRRGPKDTDRRCDRPLEPVRTAGEPGMVPGSLGLARATSAVPTTRVLGRCPRCSPLNPAGERRKAGEAFAGGPSIERSPHRSPPAPIEADGPSHRFGEDGAAARMTMTSRGRHRGLSGNVATSPPEGQGASSTMTDRPGQVHRAGSRSGCRTRCSGSMPCSPAAITPACSPGPPRPHRPTAARRAGAGPGSEPTQGPTAATAHQARSSPWTRPPGPGARGGRRGAGSPRRAGRRDQPVDRGGTEPCCAAREGHAKERLASLQGRSPCTATSSRSGIDLVIPSGRIPPPGISPMGGPWVIPAPTQPESSAERSPPPQPTGAPGGSLTASSRAGGPHAARARGAPSTDARPRTSRRYRHTTVDRRDAPSTDAGPQTPCRRPMPPARPRSPTISATARRSTCRGRRQRRPPRRCPRGGRQRLQ
jgi:hypothetical protein